MLNDDIVIFHLVPYTQSQISNGMCLETQMCAKHTHTHTNTNTHTHTHNKLCTHNAIAPQSAYSRGWIEKESCTTVHDFLCPSQSRYAYGMRWWL